MAKTAITLSTTEFDRPIVRIDEKDYRMRSPDELSVAMQKRIASVARAAERDSDDDDENAPQVTDEMLSEQIRVCMVDLPDDVLNQLGPVQKARILNTFMGLVSEAMRPTYPKARKSDGSTGRRSRSRGAGGSTAAN